MNPKTDTEKTMQRIRKIYSQPCDSCKGCGWEWDTEKLGEQLRQMREAARVDRRDVAAAMGLSSTFTGHMESGDRGARAWTPERLEIYAKTIGAELADIASPEKFIAAQQEKLGILFRIRPKRTRGAKAKTATAEGKSGLLSLFPDPPPDAEPAPVVAPAAIPPKAPVKMTKKALAEKEMEEAMKAAAKMTEKALAKSDKPVKAKPAAKPAKAVKAKPAKAVKAKPAKAVKAKPAAKAAQPVKAKGRAKKTAASYLKRVAKLKKMGAE